MANVTLNTLAAASAVADTDKMFIETAGGARALPFSVLKTAQEGYLQKKGTAIWDSAGGEATIQSIILQTGHAYEFWVSASFLGNVGCRPVVVYMNDIYDQVVHWIDYYSDSETEYFYIGAIACNIDYISILAYKLPTIERILDSHIKIFKVVDLGEISFDEVAE